MKATFGCPTSSATTTPNPNSTNPNQRPSSAPGNKLSPNGGNGSKAARTANAQPQNRKQHATPAPAPTIPTAITELNACQVDRLRSVLTERVEIHGRDCFPALRVELHELIAHVKRKLAEQGLNLMNVKMNGGAASYVLATADNFAYSDLDLIFPIKLVEEGDFDKVRTAVFAALLEIMPASANKEMICADTLKDVYVRKMVKVSSEGDRWSLFSLHNDYGRCIELKFVHRMQRPYEFSVDSFQLLLDPLLERLREEKEAAAGGAVSSAQPTIKAESMYGDIQLALSHLNKCLIDTHSPEEIRGGGLLKYCHLLSRGYHATSNCREMEKRMVTRFFIDYSDCNVQEIRLRGYLDNHFGNDDRQKYNYLHVLHGVIRSSAVCLMGHERRQTLAMVERLRHLLSYSLYYGSPSQALLPTHQQQKQIMQQQEQARRHRESQQTLQAHHLHRLHQHQKQFEQDLASNASGQSNGSEAESTPYVPRQMLLYLPPTSCQWIPVV